MNANLVILGGRLTRDPELRSTPSGVDIARLSVASTRHFTGGDGQPKEETAFVEVTAFGKTAKTVHKHFHKGSRIYLEGRLNFETWEKNGEKRSRLSVIIEDFQFVDPKPATTSGPTTEADYHGKGD